MNFIILMSCANKFDAVLPKCAAHVSVYRAGEPVDLDNLEKSVFPRSVLLQPVREPIAECCCQVASNLPDQLRTEGMMRNRGNTQVKL